MGYPQSSPELRQELISEQFVRGHSDPELKKYLWVVIRTQKDRKLQTLIEVCTDFATLGPASNIHRPAEQVFAMEEDDESEDMVAMMDYSHDGYDPFLATDVRSCSTDGLRDAADCSSCGEQSPATGISENARTGLSHAIPTGMRLLED